MKIGIASYQKIDLLRFIRLMDIHGVIDFFIHDRYFENKNRLQQARMLVRTCLLTSLFSSSYIWLSVYFEYEKGIYFMILDVVGFLILPMLLRTRLRLELVGNLYIGLGALAVIILPFYSGGLTSGIYPWIISIPILAMLVVNRTSALVWFFVSLIVMIAYGVLAQSGFEFPLEYNVDQHVLWYVSVVTGLLMIIFVITYVFATMRSRAIQFLENHNQDLVHQREMVAEKSEKLSQLVEEKDRMIAMLTHDISNTLNIVEGSLGLISKEFLPEEDRDLIEQAKSSAGNAKKLVSKTLEIGKIRNQTVELHLEEVNVEQVMMETIKTYDRMGREKGIDIVLNRSSRDFFVYADKTYLVQILENLLSNAVKYSEKGKLITCILEETDENIQVKIRDEGPGIPESEMKELFQQYSRISTRPTGGESSTGLGLSLVKYYSEMMGGTITCESKEGSGCIFTLTLPKSKIPVF